MSDTFGQLSRGVPSLRYTEREVRIWRHFWHTAALTGVLVPLLFLGAIGLGLGGLVEQNQGTVDGLDYLVFVAPGILAATALQAAAGDSLWPVMAGTKWTKAYHAAAATRLSPAQVYAGYLTWIGARMMLNATLFTVVAALLGAVPSLWGVLAIPSAALGGLAFAAPLCAYSAAQDSDLSFPVIMRVAVMPMFLFSGTFFPIDQLPAALAVVARVTPLYHAVELCRGFTTGTLGLGPAVVHVAYLAACVAVGAWFGVRTFAARLAP
jgi:lipooligosaccharide transport system permease protein